MYSRKKGRHFAQNITDINELFVDACENGDYPTVVRILEAINNFNIDVTDNLGKSALRLAVENEHLEVVKILLDKADSQKLRDTLLLAIYLGHIQIAETILRHPKYKRLNEKKFLNEDTDSFWQTPSSDDAQFSPDITPLILASQYKRTEIVQILLLAGERITKPHSFHCKCNECSNKFKFDSLRHAQSRLNAYRGLSSESYISLASLDPLQTSFELGSELRILSGKEKYFKKEYLQLADNLSLYIVKLLHNVRGRDELEIILNKTGKDNEEKYVRLARIDLALRNQEKPKLVEIWYSGIRNISKMNMLIQILLFLLFITALPFTCLVYIVAPKSKIGKFMRQPCIKFISHTTTYVGFIGMIIVSSLKFAEEQQNRERFSVSFKQYAQIFANYASNTTYKYRFPNTDFYIRMQQPSNLDYAISLWVVGYIWHEYKTIYRDGIRQYLFSWNNILSLTNSIVYAFSFGLKYYTIIQVAILKTKISTPEFWDKVATLDSNDSESLKSVYETFYWLNDDRFYWTPADPINLAEGLFALANIFTFSRICFLLPANEGLGPLQITLGKMIADVAKFLNIFVIIFVAFFFGLNNLFWYYQESVRSQVEVIDHNPNRDPSYAEKSFSNLAIAFKTLYFSLFGLGTGKEPYLKPNYDNQVTTNFGSFMYGAFHISFIIILINMLIAMMTKTYENIRIDSDIEWKFARTKLYMEYIRDGATLPVPFNIVPSLKTFINLFYKISEYIRHFDNLKNAENARPQTANTISQLNIKDGHEIIAGISGRDSFSAVPRKQSLGGDEITYTKVMQRIIKRFLLRNQKTDDDSKEKNLDEIKQDLQMVRFEINDTLKKVHKRSTKTFGTLHTSVSIVGEEVLKKSIDLALKSDFAKFKLKESEFKEALEKEETNETGISLSKTVQ